jgi:hypothetical protein
MIIHYSGYTYIGNDIVKRPDGKIIRMGWGSHILEEKDFKLWVDIGCPKSKKRLLTTKELEDFLTELEENYNGKDY